MQNQLKFKNKNFRIMLVGDPHEKPNDSSEDDKAKIEDYYTLQFAAIKQLKPDLVVLMGDNATGKNADEIRDVLLRITQIYRENNIPFTFILGNHDLESGVSDLFTLYSVYRELPCCLMPDTAEISPYGDFNLTVKSENGNEDKLNLWFIYSGSGAEKKYHSTYAFVGDEQIKWYENKAAELKNTNGKTVPAILFQHIPVPEEYNLLNKTSLFSMLFDGVNGLNEKKGQYYTLKKDGTVKGYMGEAPCSPDYNNGQFASWKKTGDVIAAFFGHDHSNDFVGMTDGIILGQCKLSSFRAYGDGLMQGVRIIDIKENSPDCIETKMHYYRDLVGNDCKSIHGSLKVLRDRTSVKLEFFAKKILPVTAAVALPIIIKKIIKKTEKK